MPVVSIFWIMTSRLKSTTIIALLSSFYFSPSSSKAAASAAAMMSSLDISLGVEEISLRSNSSSSFTSTLGSVSFWEVYSYTFSQKTSTWFSSVSDSFVMMKSLFTSVTGTLCTGSSSILVRLDLAAKTASMY